MDFSINKRLVRTSDHNGDLQYCIDVAINIGDNVYADKIAPVLSPIKIQNWTGTDFGQVSLSIKGDARMWDTAKKSLIVAKFTDAPVINIQKGKGVELSGLNISAPRGRDSRYSLQACISIDSVSGKVPSDGGYPLLEYKGSLSRGGSTGTVIDNCTTQGAQAGIIVSPNGWTQNGELMTVSNHRFIKNRFGFVGCQAQEKMNRLINIACWTEMETLMVWNKYGEGTPGHYVVDGINVAIGVENLLYRTSSGFFPLHISNVFAESLQSIGYWQSQVGDCMSNSSINFRHPKHDGFPDAHLTGGGIHFTNAIMRYYGYAHYPLLLAAQRNTYNNSFQIHYTNPIKGLYNQKASLPDWNDGFEIKFIIRTALDISPDRKAVVMNNVPNVGDILVFSKLGDAAYAGMAEVESNTGKLITMKYISEGIQSGQDYGIGIYKHKIAS